MMGAFSRRKQVSPRSRKPTIAVIDIPEHALHGVDATTATTTLLVCTSKYTRDGSISSPPPTNSIVGEDSLFTGEKRIQILFPLRNPSHPAFQCPK